MVKRLRKRKVISSSESSDNGDSPTPLPPLQAPGPTSIVDSVLRTMLSQKPPSSRHSYFPSNTQSTSAKASLHQAHTETNKGLKGKSRQSSYTHSLDKKGQSATGSRGRPKTLDFHIARIIFLPYGVDMPSFSDDPNASQLTLSHLFPTLRQPKSLSSAQLSRLEAAGLARSNFRSYFEFDREWTWLQVDALLHGQFPQLFEILDAQPKVLNPNYSMMGMVDRRYKYLPPYLLCLRSQKEIVVAGGIEFPDGETLFQKAKAGKRPSRDESELIFVTRDEIPLKLIARWITGPRQQSKGKGKGKGKGKPSEVKSDSESSIEDIESHWHSADDGLDSDDSIMSPIHSRLKRRRLDEVRIDSSSSEPELPEVGPGPSHVQVSESTTTQAGTSNILHLAPGPSTGINTIDLTDDSVDVMVLDDVTAPSPASPLPDSSLPSTLPSTPVQISTTRPPPSGSFIVDSSLSNPWKGNRIFQF